MLYCHVSILTNRPLWFQYTGTILDGVSDFHATVLATLKSQMIIPTIKILRNTSYKHFNKQIFIEDFERNNMQTCTNLKNINAAWKLFCDGFTDTLDEHAPIKDRRVRSNQAPYLNQNWKQAFGKKEGFIKKFLEIERIQTGKHTEYKEACVSKLEENHYDLILILKVIYHPLYGMNNYVLIWGDWLSCDPLRGSHDS